MTVEKIRRKVRELHAKTRRELLGNIAAPLAVVVFSGLGAAIFDDPPQRTAFALALAWALAGQYFLHRGMWSATLPGDAALTTGLEFYRREIERRRYLIRRALLWSFGPVLLTIGTFIVALAKIGGRDLPIFPNALPFLTLVLIWIAAYFVIRMREQRKLQREIDALDEIDRD